MLPTTIFASEAAAGLSFDPKSFVIQLATFGLALLVLRKFAVGPILKVLGERRNTIDSGVKLGEEMRRERAKLDDEIAEKLQGARKEAESIISGAEESGRQAVKEAEEKARNKAAGILKDAESRIEQDTKRARKQLEKELVGLISEATEAIIEEKVDAKKDAALIEKALKGRQTA